MRILQKCTKMTKHLDLSAHWHSYGAANRSPLTKFIAKYILYILDHVRLLSNRTFMSIWKQDRSCVIFSHLHQGIFYRNASVWQNVKCICLHGVHYLLYPTEGERKIRLTYELQEAAAYLTAVFIVSYLRYDAYLVTISQDYSAKKT